MDDERQLWVEIVSQDVNIWFSLICCFVNVQLQVKYIDNLDILNGHNAVHKNNGYMHQYVFIGTR